LKGLFDPAETALKLGIGRTKCHFRVNFGFAGKIGQHKEDIANFFFNMGLIGFSNRFAGFVDFFGQLSKNFFQTWPIKANAGSALGQLFRAH